MQQRERGYIGVFGGILIFLLVIGLSVGGFFLNQWVRRVTAPIEGQTRAIERIQKDPAYRIATRKQFYDRCAAVQSREAQLANVELEFETARGERKVQLQGAVTALRNSRAELITDYNAAASDDFTRGVFRDLELPFQLSIEDKETLCAV